MRLAIAVLLISVPVAAQKVNLRTQTRSTCASGTLYFAGSTGQVDCDNSIKWTRSPSYNPTINPFSIGPITPNYPFHFEIGGAVNYGGWDTGAMFGRLHTVDLPGPEFSQNAVTIVHEAYYSTGTPWALAVKLKSRVQNSNGTNAILARLEKEVQSTDISLALHGECFNYSLTGACVGLSAEVINLGSVASGTELIGISSNVGVGGGHIGSTNPIKGLKVSMNHLGNNTLGYGASIIAGTGTHAYGVRVEEAGGTFTVPFSIHSARSAPSIFEMINAAPGTGTAPNQIIFGRAADQRQGMIQSDIMAAADFANGYVDIYTNKSSTMTKAVRFDADGNQIMERGYVQFDTRAFAALGSGPAGAAVYCIDCTTAATCVGGGSGHLAVSNGTVWTCQ